MLENIRPFVRSYAFTQSLKSTQRNIEEEIRLMMVRHMEEELEAIYDKIEEELKAQDNHPANPNQNHQIHHNHQHHPNHRNHQTHPNPKPNPKPTPEPNPNPEQNPNPNPNPNPYKNHQTHLNPEQNPRPNPKPNPNPEPNPNPNPIAPTLAPTPTPTPLIKKHSNLGKHKNGKAKPKPPGVRPETPEAPPETPEVLPEAENEPYDKDLFGETVRINLRWLCNALSDEKRCLYYKRFDSTYKEINDEYLPHKLILIAGALGRRFENDIALENYMKELIQFTTFDDEAEQHDYLPVMSLFVLKGAPSTDKNSLPILKLKLSYEEFVTIHVHLRRLLPENIRKQFYPS
jgi:DNA mismatch repair ATPase MutL